VVQHLIQCLIFAITSSGVTTRGEVRQLPQGASDVVTPLITSLMYRTSHAVKTLLVSAAQA